VREKNTEPRSEHSAHKLVTYSPPAKELAQGPSDDFDSGASGSKPYAAVSTRMPDDIKTLLVSILSEDREGSAGLSDGAAVRGVSRAEAQDQHE
jgi:hypothetical protein